MLIAKKGGTMAQKVELSERKHTILRAIIQNYLETGEPVGSRTISKYSDLKLSSATIRNEMSDLEELGYIVCNKSFVGRKPRTVFQATPQGREAFKSHIEALEKFLKSK